jgi:hypothetical protein
VALVAAGRRGGTRGVHARRRAGDVDDRRGARRRAAVTGVYDLEIGVLHEDVRWFGSGAHVAVTVV